MTAALLLGFLVVGCAGVAARSRGRKAAAWVLVAGIAPLVVVGVTAGREAMSAFMVGALVGLPVFVGGLIVRDRRDRRS